MRSAILTLILLPFSTLAIPYQRRSGGAELEALASSSKDLTGTAERESAPRSGASGSASREAQAPSGRLSAKKLSPEVLVATRPPEVDAAFVQTIMQAWVERGPAAAQEIQGSLDQLTHDIQARWEKEHDDLVAAMENFRTGRQLEITKFMEQATAEAQKKWDATPDAAGKKEAYLTAIRDQALSFFQTHNEAGDKFRAAAEKDLEDVDARRTNLLVWMGEMARTFGAPRGN